MIRAKAADGSVHTFPDGTPDAVVDKAMREYAQRSAPGYAKARARLKTEDKRLTVPGAPDLSSFGRRVAGTTGASDEVGGAVRFGLQGVENLFRRATGQPIETTAPQAYLAAADSEKEWQANFAKEHPVQNVFANIAGIATTGRPTGGAAIRNPFRAGAAVAAQNAPFAYTRQEGTVSERLPGTAAESAMAFGMGSALTAGSNALARRAAQARAAPPTPARRLSQQGVELTPGQMAGGVIQRAEDAATSIPVVGDSIRGARVRGLESFNRAALDRSLAPIGATMPQGVAVGRDGLREAERAIGTHYDNALQRVQVAPDAQYVGELTAVEQTPNLTAAQRETLGTIVADLRSRFGQAVSGREWKVLDSDLGKAIRAADNASQNQPGGQALTRALERLKAAHVDLLGRTDPAVMAAVRQGDEATANLVRIRQASQYTGSSARNGVFSPADLNRSVQGMDTSAGNRAFARGDAMMQDLTDPAMQTLPATVPDSGTPLRSLFTAGAGGAGLAALGTNPQALAVAGGAAAATAAGYSAPVQRMLNEVYRAKTPGMAREALSRLAQLAARDPAFVPAYTEAARALGVPLAGNGGRPAPQ